MYISIMMVHRFFLFGVAWKLYFKNWTYPYECIVPYSCNKYDHLLTKVNIAYSKYIMRLLFSYLVYVRPLHKDSYLLVARQSSLASKTTLRLALLVSAARRQGGKQLRARKSNELLCLVDLSLT